MASASEVRRRHEERLLSTPGVVGVAVGRREGEACILVYVDADPARVRKVLPRAIEGVAVEIVETGAFRARADG